MKKINVKRGEKNERLMLEKEREREREREREKESEWDGMKREWTKGKKNVKKLNYCHEKEK